VQTFMPFNAQNCDDTTPITINKFKDGKFTNRIEHFFPKKLKKLHNCPVQVGVTILSEPFSIANKLPNGSYKFTGQDINLIETLSEKLNFKINYTYLKDVGFIDQNGTAGGSFKALLDKQVYLLISGWQLRVHRLKFFDASVSYNTEKIIFIVPPGSDLTSFEHLIFPFEFSLWISILSCFLIGLFVIFLMNSRSKVVQNFVFGTGVRNPYLNMFIAFIGGSQNKLPGRNFARFLLMMFLMYSLIIRTIYQASFYQLLKSNKRHREVQSVDEMIEKDFKIYSFSSYLELFETTEGLKKRFE
jgi:Bacterial extracellular solute-binding proteins, family 3